MSVEWYLMTPPNSQVSGLEDDDFMPSAKDAFLETLETNVASDVELYNYDLSECTPLRAIIQNKLTDTKLKTLTRHMLAPIGSCKAGMYVKIDGRYWLIVGIVDNNTVYEKAVLSICNYLLTWVNSKGKIVQRWTNVSSASQYNNGETSTDYYFVRSDQLLILMPDDDESLLLDTGARFIIDQRCKVYEKSLQDVKTQNCSKSVNVYKVTRTDTVLFDYQDSGHNEIMVYQDEQGVNDGYYVIDGKGYWLCDPNYMNKTSVLSSEIKYQTTELYPSIEPVVLEACFYDEDKNVVDVSPIWEIRCDFVQDLNLEFDGNKIKISTENKKLKGKDFVVVLKADGYEEVTLTISIKSFI